MGIERMLRMYLLHLFNPDTEDAIYDASYAMCKFRHLLEEKVRDPEIHQTKKGNEWRFGTKSHIGVDAGSGLVHTTEVTAANVHDVIVASRLIRADDEVVYGDSGYLSLQKRRS